MPTKFGPDQKTGRYGPIKPAIVGLNIVCEGKKIRCTECNKKFISLHLIESTGEQLCESCLEGKGGFEYMGIIKLLDEDYPGAG